MESQINELKEKYWAGLSSVAEEKILKDYFSKEKSQANEAMYFEYLQQKATQKSPYVFKQPGKRVSFPKWLMAAAISIGIISGVFLLQISKTQDKFAIEDPQQAYKITRQALLTISTKMNKAEVIADNLEKFSEAQKLISEKN
ncbi:MAG: hypothetical protein HN704_13695 [Bacteroidetes bacterium]|mgnify:CR=1 FL=1|jgi:hypothetical protein|nr:hypothetical protein [Bacteroidota bacterium]MBT6687077.1 hypothetical protein [Bacteroidota bacterium]MBT7142820.1 hypothetical protein [Bacteroidota bacterium]MBT7492649.1 hypothetical protein [Bacteroidota bacterium]